MLGRVESDAIEGTLHRTDDVENFSERSVTSVQKQNGILERKKIAEEIGEYSISEHDDTKLICSSNLPPASTR